WRSGTFSFDMGAAPHTPPSAPRSGSGPDRAGSSPEMAPVPVITHPHAHADGVDLSHLERDALVLTAEERRWGRRRVITRAGRTLALALPTGSVLTPGDVLYVGPGWYVVAEAAREPVLAVTPRSRAEALRIALCSGGVSVTALASTPALSPTATAARGRVTSRRSRGRCGARRGAISRASWPTTRCSTR